MVSVYHLFEVSRLLRAHGTRIGNNPRGKYADTVGPRSKHARDFEQGVSRFQNNWTKHPYRTMHFPNGSISTTNKVSRTTMQFDGPGKQHDEKLSTIKKEAIISHDGKKTRITNQQQNQQKGLQQPTKKQLNFVEKLPDKNIKNRLSNYYGGS